MATIINQASGLPETDTNPNTGQPTIFAPLPLASYNPNSSVNSPANLALASAASDASPDNKANVDPTAEEVAGGNSAAANLTNPPLPRSETDIYNDYLTQNASVLDAINQSYDSELAAENTTEDIAASDEEAGGKAALIAGGLLGSSADVAESGQVAAKAGAVKLQNSQNINAQRAQAVATNLQNLQSAAQTQANTEKEDYYDKEAPEAVTQSQNTANTIKSNIAGLAASGVSWQQFSTDPTYATLYNNAVQYGFNGDAGAADAYFASQIPASAIQQSSVTTDSSGNSVVHLLVKGANGAYIQNFTLNGAVPQGYNVTTLPNGAGFLLQDPNNPGNIIVYPTNPDGSIGSPQTIGGAPAPTGGTTATGGNTTADSTATVSPAVTNVSGALGVDPSTSLSDVVSKNGVAALTSAIIQNEGGSPKGVVNNPGNIKYTGAAGQTDSGVKATDGGTFASYATPADGINAIHGIINNAASGKSGAYGTNPTLGQFVGAYTGTSTPNGTGSGSGASSGADLSQYGLLANVQGFNPSTGTQAPNLDSNAANYIKDFMSTGTLPSAADLGISTRQGKGQYFSQVQTRANELYKQATGKDMPTAPELSNNLDIINNNNSLLTNLSNQTGVIGKNFGLSLQNLNTGNVNDAWPILNGVIDSLTSATGNPAVAQYLSQNETLSNEMASLLAVKNAGGTTVQDKLSAAGLMPKDATPGQQVQIVKTLLQEAVNATQSIGQSNASLYKETDPLGVDPQNPINAPGYSAMTGAGFTDNFDGTWSDSGGNSYSVTPASGKTPAYFTGPDGTNYALPNQ